jgi:hypothetical protein
MMRPNTWKSHDDISEYERGYNIFQQMERTLERADMWTNGVVQYHGTSNKHAGTPELDGGMKVSEGSTTPPTTTSLSLKTEGLNRRAFEPRLKRRLQHQSRKFLADVFIGWRVNEMPVPTPVRTTFNCHYSFAQIKPQSDFL